MEEYIGLDVSMKRDRRFYPSCWREFLALHPTNASRATQRHIGSKHQIMPCNNTSDDEGPAPAQVEAKGQLKAKPVHDVEHAPSEKSDLEWLAAQLRARSEAGR